LWSSSLSPVPLLGYSHFEILSSSSLINTLPVDSAILDTRSNSSLVSMRKKFEFKYHTIHVYGYVSYVKFEDSFPYACDLNAVILGSFCWHA
jgi:hypothetical protein